MTTHIRTPFRLIPTAMIQGIRTKIKVHAVEGSAILWIEDGSAQWTGIKYEGEAAMHAAYDAVRQALQHRSDGVYCLLTPEWGRPSILLTVRGVNVMKEEITRAEASARLDALTAEVEAVDIRVGSVTKIPEEVEA